MTNVVKSLLGGRYKLTGVIARGGRQAAHRAWDRWLERHVEVSILPSATIEDPTAEQRFVRAARALARVEHPHLAALLDFGATAEGAPYLVTQPVAGRDLATLLAEDGTRPWTEVRRVLLDVGSALAAMHRRGLVHGDVELHNVVIGDAAKLVGLGRVELDEDYRDDYDEDIHGLAAIGFALLTGHGPVGRSPIAIEAALARTDAPPAIRSLLAAVLQGTVAAPREVAALRRAIRLGSPRRRSSRPRPRPTNLAAAAAAVVMLTIGIWSQQRSVNELAHAVALDGARDPGALDSGAGTLACGLAFDPGLRSERDARAERGARPERESPLAAIHEHVCEDEVDVLAAIVDPELLYSPLVELGPLEPEYTPGRARVEVVAESRRDDVKVHSQRFDLHRDLAPDLLVERGIDLTHGRPTPEDDPRLPILDGPERARRLFEAACERDYGKGCHMLGVQLAEGMIADTGAGPAAHYRRGCELDYHRSCSALADLARAGDIEADAGHLEAKACLLAGPSSSYCRPRG